MKKLYSTIILFAALAMTSNAQQVWDNFEDVRQGTYGFINGVFIPYTENPAPNGINDSQVVATYSRNPAETFDVIILDALMDDLNDYISGTKQISIDVWSPAAGIPIQITLENSVAALPDNFPTGRHSVYLTTTTVAQAWETLTFTFDTQPDATVPNNQVNRLVLLFNPNTQTGDTYYWDNLNGPELANDPCEGVATDESILNDFECQQNVNFIFSSSGPNFRRIINPDQTGNTSEYVATYSRNAGEELDVLIGRFDGNLELNAESGEIQLDVWDANAPSTVLLSLQTGTNDLILEVPAQIETASSWQTLTFDVSPVIGSTDIEQFVILYEPGEFVSNQYYFDNFTVPGLVSNNDIEYVSELKAFPNPANTEVSLQYTLQTVGDVSVTITDITGRVLENRNFKNQPNGTHLLHFNTDAYADGIYLYNLRVGGNNNTGKFVVNK